MNKTSNNERSSWKQGRKCRDISAIYRVSKGFDTIFHGEIFVRRYFRDLSREIDYLSREIDYLSRYIGDLAINRRFFSDISRGQRGSTKVRRATVPRQRATASTFVCCWEDLNPKPFCLGFTRLPPGLSYPLIYNMQQLYIYLNSLYKENIRIF